VQGEVTVEVRTDSPEDRFYPGAILQTDPTKFGPLTVSSVRNHNGTLLLKFQEIADRNEIEPLKNVLLLSEVDTEAESGEDEFHLQQILGCIAELEDGRKIGPVVDVMHLPGQDLLVIDNNGRESLIPFVKEIVPTVEIKNKKIVVVDKEGLLEE
jgi:16S rRNA processing protein RimM